ncbi:centrosome-associated protein 350-like [Athalia rosae]|uniref:centrosome-associated protein 350-like n=1 Tax=Athalia rosae TaxID=37344 RepID=UPI00203413D6|nr:centrosome-associated protein 350-like [Athalia rosae]
MKSNINKEETETKKKYVFFSDPDVIVRRAESTAATSQALQNFKIFNEQYRACPELNQFKPESSTNPQTKSDIKGLETLLSYHPVQPYPFTFITAVKRKLALNMHDEACKRAYEPDKLDKSHSDVDISKTITDFKRNINQAAQKMDFIRPLKVPDLKISPKTLDYSIKDGFTAKDFVQPLGGMSAKKFDAHALDDVSLGSNKSPKNGEKAHRKLDFSLLEGSPIKNCENIEPLKVPELSISSSLSKKKEHARDSSREKENRSKRIKKDDSSLLRKDDILKDTPRRSKTSKHVSRKDIEEEPDSMFEMFKAENFLSSVPRESDFGLKKPKSKNFLTSTAKKNEDKKHRSASMQSVRSVRERSSESKNRNYDTDSNSEKNIKSHDRITIRDSSRGKLSDNDEHLHKVTTQDFNSSRQCNDHKYKNPEPLSLKQQKHSSKLVSPGQTKQFENYSKIQMKKSYEKQRPANSESDAKDIILSDTSDDNKAPSGSLTSLKDAGYSCRIDVTSKSDDSLRNETLSQQSKSNQLTRESDQPSRTTSRIEKVYENSEEIICTEKLPCQSTNTDSQTVDGTVSEALNKSNSGYENSLSKSSSGILLDPVRISFRDESLEEQNEFCDLVTPDINLLPRSKRRKNVVKEQDSETELRSPKHKPLANNTQSKDVGIQLFHPTALHMQFQAELHLLDSFNESLRQVMDVENCLYNATQDKEQEFSLRQKENQIRRKNLLLLQRDREKIQSDHNIPETLKKNDFSTYPTTSEGKGENNSKEANHEVMNTGNENPSVEPAGVLDCVKQSQDTIGGADYALRKHNRLPVSVIEVQTQTANDIATQTEAPRVRRRHTSPGRQIPGITYQRGSAAIEEIPQLSLESFDQFEECDQIENISLPSRMHTMSEISLHETTSSIRTETGTEISISRRDVTCSFNKYLDSELAQLIKDEKERYDEIEMLFKSREKTLNDRTKKLVKLEEQKRALRDMGQDSRISSVKKKQRALLLKLQQEKDEMTRLKELHKKASQERKLMLQKQRNMLNPQMSTKNILTKLKRSADSQSPRRLSGPMKGYDIRSPSSMSSLVDSDKSQLDRSHLETKVQIPDVRVHKSEGRMIKSDNNSAVQERHDAKSLMNDQFDNLTEHSDLSLMDSKMSPDSQKLIMKQLTAQKLDGKSRYEAKSCKYKEAMPTIDNLHHKSHVTHLESNTLTKKLPKSSDASIGPEKLKFKEIQLKPALDDPDKSISENIRSETDTLVDDISKKSKSSQATEINFGSSKPKREKEYLNEKNIPDLEDLDSGESDSIAEELSSRKSKSSQVIEDISEMTSKTSSKNQYTSMTNKEISKKSQSSSKNSKSSSKRKGSRSIKSKSSSDILSENILRSKSSSQIPEEIVKYHSKRSKIERDDTPLEGNHQSCMMDDIDVNESQSSLDALVKHSRAVKEKNYQLLKNIANEHEAKENMSRKELDKLRSVSGRQDGNLKNVGNMSTRSQVSTLTISHHSSGESEKSYSRSVVIRAQDHHFRTSKKLEQILNAREAALASRRNCVEEWIAWHSRLRAEESRVARMEEAAFKLVSAASNALSYHDTTVSSDTSDVESRIEVLAEKLAERRTEMARLKREAKRQAKQRLKALEANLLNQIKKYDTTIHEMRKKLENKRGVLNDGLSEKLPIESKSLTDFKIPDIPIERIKEICKNSDLSKSRSESELRNLISDNSRRKDQDNAYGSENSEHEYSSYRKALRSTVSDIIDPSEVSVSDRKATTQSIQSIFEDVKSTASRASDFISENIESGIISERIEDNSRLITARSSSDKSGDESSNISAKIESDSKYNETEYSRSAKIHHTEVAQHETRGTDNDQGTPIEQVKDSEGSVVSGKSRRSSNQETSSISESIQEVDSVREGESESIKSNSEIEHSKSYDVSIAKSVPISISSEKIVEAISIATAGDIVSTTEGSAAISQMNVDNSVQKSQSMSNKLSFLELGDKNLNHDISTLENDLKTLSEMMSQFSKKSDSKLKPEIIHENEGRATDITGDSEKGTSADITDLDNPQSDLNTSANDSKTNKSPELSESDIVCQDKDELGGSIIANNNATYIVEEQCNDSEINDKDLTAQVTEIMLKIMPENSTSPKSVDKEIDFKARSREILNEIEKSIISEHVKSPELADMSTKLMEENISSLENKNEEVIDYLNSLEHDIMSIAEIISHASDAKKDIRKITSIGTDHLFDENIVEPPSISDASKLEQSDRKSQTDEEDSHGKQILNIPLGPEANEEEEEYLQSLNSISDRRNSHNVAKHLEQTDAMFETIKDPEYEDISEESLEVSEIMDKSESHRSDRQGLEKTHRLPEKYEIKQKSEDVLRILDEITQKSNNGLQRSQHFSLTPDNHGKKIDELLQRSGKLSQNFEAMKKKPIQANTVSDLPIVNAVSRAELISKHQEIIAIDQENNSSKKSTVPPSKIENILRDFGVPDSSGKPDASSDPNSIAHRITPIVEATESASDTNISAAKLDDRSTVEKSLKETYTESEVGRSSQKSEASSDKSSGEVSEEISQDDKIGEISESDIINMILDYQEVGCVIKETSDPEINNVTSKSEEELEKPDSHSCNVDVIMHQPQSTSPTLRSEENLSKQENKGKIQLTVDESTDPPNLGRQSDSKIPDESSELNLELQLDDRPIIGYQDASQKVDEMHEPSQDLSAMSQNSEDSSNKTNIGEKSDCASQKSDESQASEKSEDILQKYEVELPSESSEEVDTPRSVSEIEMDSPRDPNDSRLDIENLDDDLLATNNELRTEFHATPVVATSEKDIEAMIDKLKVSLEQPGLDVAELEAKLLRIQQLQIELEIKKLEAEEVSYYVREIPNKPPPPYTPPSGGRLSVSQTSPSPVLAVVPTNVDDLTAFTERATHLIYRAKQSGEDIINLEHPIEIIELSKDNNETTRRDRKIYNTFLFDLCKETISEVYQSEYEKPGPSWLKPNAKTKPVMKIPKTVEGLNDYVSKEVATLFGFKTKLQRENLVMRWSRKRRDRVDELLAREAQAEEDEWTKFHHDELAVKNELTTAILDSLILDAANVVKMAYMKKRKIIS